MTPHNDDLGGAHTARPPAMTATAFRSALARLGWTQTRAARELGAANRQRVSEWATGRRRLPDYIAAHLRTHLLCHQRERIARLAPGAGEREANWREAYTAPTIEEG